MVSKLQVRKRDGVWCVLIPGQRQPVIQFWEFGNAIHRAQELARGWRCGA